MKGMENKNSASTPEHDENRLVRLKPKFRGQGVLAAGELGDSSFGVGFLIMPFREGSPLNDLRVRKAISLAMDRKALSAPGDLLPNGSLLDARLLGAIDEGDAHQEDLELARATLAEAGFPGGKGMRPLKVSGRFKLPELLTEQLARIGIRVERLAKPADIDDPSVDILSTGWTGEVFDGSDPGPTLVSLSLEHLPRIPEISAFDPMSLLFEGDLSKRTQLYLKTHRMLLNAYRILPYGHIDETTGQIVDLRLEHVWRRS